MDALAVPLHSHLPEDETRVRLLLADDDAAVRSLLASYARATVESFEVLEASDGAEAVQLGLQQRPQIAVLDVDMPRLGGIEAAITLRELQPPMRVALQTADPRLHRARASVYRLPLFDKSEVDHALSWLAVQARACGAGVAKRTLECPSCGYGIACWRPPARCPMCQGEEGWIRGPGAHRRDVAPVV